jgi:hypothetical protein
MYFSFSKLNYWKQVLWTIAYYLLMMGGATIETIKKYIEDRKNISSRRRASSDSSPSKLDTIYLQNPDLDGEFSDILLNF